MEEHDSIRKLGLIVFLILSGTFWTVSSYLHSKEAFQPNARGGGACAGCPDIESPRPEGDAFTSLESLALPDAG